jgi:inner membrane transporter RhtA
VPAPLLVLGSISSVQIGSALARTLFDALGATGVTALRLVLSSLILLAIARPRVGRWSRGTWWAATQLGVAMAGMNLAFYLALRTVPLGVAVTVEFLGPLLLTLVQTRRFPDLLWALLAATGVVLLGLQSHGGMQLSGLALALVAGLFWAGYILANAHVGALLPGMDGLAVAVVIATVLLLPFGAGEASAVVQRPVLLIPALGVALLSSVICYALELAALRRIPTRVFGVLMSLEPGAAAVAGFLLLGQRLGLREVVALVAVSVASVGVTIGRRGDRLPLQPLE